LDIIILLVRLSIGPSLSQTAAPKAPDAVEKRCRNMRTNPIIFSLLATACAVSAFAAPPDGRGAREAIRAYQFQHVAVERGEAPAKPPERQPDEQRRGRESGVLDSSGYGTQPNNQAGSSGEQGRKQGKMTPEERRALRRQIDEAGHDIYTPKR
jgi:hypothetical protein